MSATILVAAVGDLQLGDSPTTVGYGFYSRYRGQSIAPLFADFTDRFKGADIVFGNLETNLSRPPVGSSRRSTLQLRGEPQFASELAQVGFTVLNVANNHAVQHGEDSFRATVDAIRVAGIACCGIRGQSPWTSEPVHLPIRGRAVGVLGYCLRPRQYGSAVPPYAEGDCESICADVARLAQLGAIVIVSLHWGEEFVPHPSNDEVNLGHAIIDAGAALILGHHPHVSRPVEAYHSGLIAYSLGNFMGDMVWYAPFRRGLLLRCSVTDRVVADISIDTTLLGRDFRPRILTGVTEGSVPDGELTGLGARIYEAQIRKTWRRQRMSAYVSALVNLPRTPPRLFAQLAMDTLRNKIAGMRQSAPDL